MPDAVDLDLEVVLRKYVENCGDQGLCFASGIQPVCVRRKKLLCIAHATRLRHISEYVQQGVLHFGRRAGTQIFEYLLQSVPRHSYSPVQPHHLSSKAIMGSEKHICPES